MPEIRDQRKNARGTCSFDDCTKPHDSKGYCKTHAEQVRRGKPLTKARAWGVYRKDNKCSVENCNVVNLSLGLCSRHFRWATQYHMTVIAMNHFHANYACKVCGGTQKLVVDHDHNCCPEKGSCGQCVRGILCSGCNTALGLVKDDPARLRRLAEYLERSAGLNTT